MTPNIDNRFVFGKKAKNLFEVLVSSKNDGRFQQWLDCFAILFGTNATEIRDEYVELR